MQNKKAPKCLFGSRTEPKYSLFDAHPDGTIHTDHFTIKVGIFGDVLDQSKTDATPPHGRATPAA